MAPGESRQGQPRGVPDATHRAHEEADVPEDGTTMSTLTATDEQVSATPAKVVQPAWVRAMHEFLNERPAREAPQRQVAEHGMKFVPPGPAWREGTEKRNMK